MPAVSGVATRQHFYAQRDHPDAAARRDDARRALTRVGREIENRLRTIESGAARVVFGDRLQEWERERAARQAQRAASHSTHASRPVDLRHLRRVLDDGLVRQQPDSM